MIFVGLFFAELLVIFFLSRIFIRSLGKFLLKILHNPRLTVGILAVLFLPGVVIHEMAHFFMAAIFGVPVGEISLVPEVEGEEVRLGSVQIGKTDPIRRMLVGLAPVLVGTAILIGTAVYFLKDANGLNWWQLGLVILAFFEIGNTMFSSRKDLEGALLLVVGAVVIGGVFIAAYFYGARLPSSVTALEFPAWVSKLALTADKLLLLPMGINLIFAIVSNYVNRKVGMRF